MVWEIKLKETHPYPSFRRDGIVFVKEKPTILKELSETLKKELACPGTPLMGVKIEDKIVTLQNEIDKYEEKIIEPNDKTYRGDLTPVRAIRKFCVECSGSQKAPRNCEKKTCPLFNFRLGKSPGRAGIGGGGNKKDSGNLSAQNLRKKGS